MDDTIDTLQWNDPATGLPCAARAISFAGIWCGYVGVPPSHPWYRKHFNDIPDIRVHGGLSYSDELPLEAQVAMVAETTAGAEVLDRPEIKGAGSTGNAASTHAKQGNDHIWWFGFDCAHCFDVMPALGIAFPDSTYKDFNYIKEQCALLAAQLAEVRV